MRKAGAKDYKSYSKKILKICNKKPVVNLKGLFTGKIIKELNSKDIKLNITAIYSAKQTEKIQ